MGRGATALLVHGGRHGGWCWDRLLAPLRAGGLEPIAPSLTGLAERRHLLCPSVDLETHVADLVTLLEFEDLRDVVVIAVANEGTGSPTTGALVLSPFARRGGQVATAASPYALLGSARMRSG